MRKRREEEGVVALSPVIKKKIRGGVGGGNHPHDSPKGGGRARKAAGLKRERKEDLRNQKASKTRGKVKDVGDLSIKRGREREGVFSYKKVG